MPDFSSWIQRLSLLPHPEGGFWAPAFRSDEHIPAPHLPERYDKSHPFWSSIYFMVTAEDFSAFHRLQSDELWHFYEGDAVCLHLIYPDGHYEQPVLGRNPEQGEALQCLVRRGTWFAAEVQKDGAYGLCGCTLSPGWEEADFELAVRKDLSAQFPQHSGLIRRLTRQ
jgi:predicted cupin superfamily sugar epimerase